MLKKYSNYLIVFAVFFVAILSILYSTSLKQEKIKEENKVVTENSQETNNNENGNVNENKNENETAEKDTEENTKKDEQVELNKISFPYVIKSFPNIIITSTNENKILIGENDGFNFNIVNINSSETDKYGFEFFPDIGSIRCEHNDGLYEEDIKSGKNYLINKEYGTYCPIVGESVTWYPEQNTLGTEETYKKLENSDYKNKINIYVKVINLRTKNIEDAFYLTFAKVDNYYVFNGIEECTVEKDISDKLITQTKTIVKNVTNREYFSKCFVAKLKTPDYLYFENPSTKEDVLLMNNTNEIYVVYLNYPNINNQEISGFTMAYYDSKTLAFIGTKTIIYKNV